MLMAETPQPGPMPLADDMHDGTVISHYSPGREPPVASRRQRWHETSCHRGQVRRACRPALRRRVLMAVDGSEH